MRILQPTPDAIAQVVAELQAGNLVVIPTETVYGLAADISQPEAINKIFEAKGRPRSNPLIVHLGARAQVEGVARSIPPYAQELMDQFWPGPLTLVVQKQESVNAAMTAGLDTVAVRMPRHPVALAILQALGKPLAAPSANRFMDLSPTRAEHVCQELGVKLVIDGGPCDVGLESTIVDATSDSPRILRYGMVTKEQLEDALGREVLDLDPSQRIKAPGQHPRHYAPKTPVILVDQLGKGPGLRFGGHGTADQIALPQDPTQAATELYSALFELDQRNLEIIRVERPPQTPEWQAINDRLTRAST